MKITAVYWACLFLFVSAESAICDTVVATGMSFYETGREVLAREKALDEAVRIIEDTWGR